MNFYLKNYIAIILILSSFAFCACSNKDSKSKEKKVKSEKTYTNPLLPAGARPWATFHNGEYFYLQDSDNRIVLWRTKDITNLKNAPSKEIWIPQDKNSAFHLWAPELHRINNKWYIYFAADDGNTDNHQLYVIENDSEDPFEGEFTLKGRIKTDKNNNWAIHPSVFEHKDELYLIWSGWQTRRIETETQYIYIAKMENPWTLSTDRVAISKPEYEWERQWINPDGSKTGYPIYVNEDPQFFHSKEKNKALIFYAASGTWTPYYAVGMLSADYNSNLLDPASWEKTESPVFTQNGDNQVFATGTPCFIPSPDGKEIYFLYQARSIEKEPYGSLPSGPMDTRSPRLQKMEWDSDGIPALGEALSEGEKLTKPSGTE